MFTIELRTCNRCGKEQSNEYFNDVNSGFIDFGYGSDYDTKQFEFSLCDSCFDEFRHSFLMWGDGSTDSINEQIKAIEQLIIAIQLIHAKPSGVESTRTDIIGELHKLDIDSGQPMPDLVDQLAEKRDKLKRKVGE